MEKCVDPHPRGSGFRVWALVEGLCTNDRDETINNHLETLGAMRESPLQEKGLTLVLRPRQPFMQFWIHI